MVSSPSSEAEALPAPVADDPWRASERADFEDTHVSLLYPDGRPKSWWVLSIDIICATLRRCDGSRSAAARALMMNRRTLQRMLAKRNFANGALWPRTPPRDGGPRGQPLIKYKK